jgi:predicted N-acyltransferase
MSKEKPEGSTSSDIVIRVLDHPGQVPADDWDALLERQSSPTPFMQSRYLVAMHDSKSAVDDTGWLPQYLTAWRDERLVAACPLYLKDHSYGEYVFDWAWADAYQRHGLRYYPKLLSAVPFTPVPGSRLLAVDAPARSALLQAMRQLAMQAKLSSAHVLFLDADDQQAAQDAGWMMRSTVQFHWTRREPEPWTDFADFLAGLQREKRKKIQQERRRVREAGVEFSVLEGTAITEEDWDFFYRCYTLTYRAHRSTPYLTRDFFARMAATMPQNWLLFTAWKDGHRIAVSLLCIDPQRGHAFGRYWGAIEQVSCLHFDACYYQPIEWCIAKGYRRFEGGAQGEHKMARGLMPVQTFSAHWLAHPEFARAVADFLAQEGQGVEHYLDELNERQPFRRNAAPEA